MDGLRAGAANLATRAGSGAFANLTAATLEQRLALRRRAREDAARDFPPADADEISPAERAVVETVAAGRTPLETARQALKADTERTLRGLLPPAPDLAGPTLAARLALRQAAGRLAHEWSEAASAAAQGRTDLAAFKQAHGLRRAAVYPRSGLLQAGLLLCAAVFEALFSAAVFAEDDERGLLGGALTAVGLSGANVTLGFLAGYLGLRYLQHTRWPVKTLGAFGFAAAALLALMLNLFAADWRDRMATLSGRQLDLGADASFHLWSLLQLDSPQAIILLMLGGGVWVFAAMKGYSGFDDPYPDYGKMDRAARAASDALSALHHDAREDLEAPIAAARAELDARLGALRGQVSAMNKAFDAAAQRMEALDAEARALDEAAAAAIHLYRRENTTARRAPAPGYFSAAPPAAGPALDALGPSAAMMDEARARLTQAQMRSAEALEALQIELEDTTKRLDAGAAL